MEEVHENLNEDIEEENDINLLNINRTRKKLKILDSDSDSENEESSASRVTEISNSKSSVLHIDEISTVDNETAETINLNKYTKDNSDSEKSAEEVTPYNKSFPDEETAVKAVISSTSGKVELNLVSSSTGNSNVQKSSLLSLCDADSSEEEESNKDIEEDIIDGTIIQPKIYKPPRKRNKDDKQKKMTVQEAAKQRVEIQSELQRMVRESNVSLPYHKPKTYTIKEFFQKRSKLASALPLIPKAPPSVAIKMSKDKLEEVSKKLDERIKQVEEFYKSESEDEDEEKREVTTNVIRNWLEELVDNAVNSVEKEVECEESKMCNLTERDDDDVSDNQTKTAEPFSMDYEFNLDDVDEQSSKRSNVTEVLKDKILSIQPKLSGRPDDIIDLEAGVTKPNEVRKLVERFFQHTLQKVQHKHKVELDVMGVTDKGEIIKETVSMDVEEEEAVVEEPPGAKLQRLREELQNQMARKRSELWKQKQEQGDYLSTERKMNEKSECGAEKDIFDDEEEEEIEMTESESEGEEEEVENYALKPEKRKSKSAFIEDEAGEDSDVEEDNNEEALDENEKDEEEQEEEDDVNENNGFDGDDEKEVENNASENPKKKTLKRIIKAFTEDSDEDEEEFTPDILFTKVAVRNSHDSTASGEDEFCPPNLPRVDNTPQRPLVDNGKSELDFLTPVTYLTGLQNLGSDSKFTKESPLLISPFHMPLEPSPSNESKGSLSLQKNLFSEQSISTQNTQDNVDELANMCSGQFPETQNCMIEDENISKDGVPSTQELLNICSGGFSGSASDYNSTKTENRNLENVINIQTNADNEAKCLDDDHGLIISQLLDEDELERFKKKFESPVTSVSQRNRELADIEEVNATGLINSDDENEELEIKKKRGQKKLVFSDDDENSEDDEGECEQLNEDEIDLHDSDDEEQVLEKEIEAQESANYKLTDFFENEAELSESDWDSADEDEKGLDELEFEQGDEETFNENKVRSELERIHMRQILDEDNREVKILQELLLEDGEMHGTGRQRQFRWKALDSAENSEFEKRDDDDIFLDEEEESEEQWRKTRHKREMFLKKKSTSDDVESILSDSQILNIGKKVIIKNSQPFNSQNSTTTDEPEVKEKELYGLLNKRGSFLSRSDQVLQRLAEYNKVTSAVVGNTAKNSRCFLFQTVDTAETVTIKHNNNNKRKAVETTPHAIKKLRLSNFSPAINKKQPEKNAKFKNLFGNW